MKPRSASGLCSTATALRLLGRGVVRGGLGLGIHREDALLLPEFLHRTVQILGRLLGLDDGPTLPLPDFLESLVGDPGWFGLWNGGVGDHLGRVDLSGVGSGLGSLLRDGRVLDLHPVLIGVVGHVHFLIQKVLVEEYRDVPSD